MGPYAERSKDDKFRYKVNGDIYRVYNEADNFTFKLNGYIWQV